MTAVWSSPRDEYPQSVHDLMALWGGFDAPSGSDDCGLEKRLELNFRRPVPPAVLCAADLRGAVSRAGESLSAPTGGAVRALRSERSVLVLSARRVVWTAAGGVRLHESLAALVAAVRAVGADVEWASFVRLNARSPWTAAGGMGDAMAREYAALKGAFPAGHAFLTGPVDREHFFHFVYDAVDRRDAARREEDVQVNVYMANVRGARAKCAQHVTHFPDGGYECLRVVADGAAQPFATCETNVLSAAHLRGLIARFRPDRFTVVSLQDRHTDAEAQRALVRQIDGYTVLNRAVNQLAEGYAYHQTVFVRDA